MMAHFILIEPSCDIHLVHDPAFPDDKRAVRLRVFNATFDAALGRYAIEEIFSDLEFDFFPLDQTVVRFNDVLDSLTPLALGTVHMQVRYMDPGPLDEYHYLLARIQVHQKMNGWWFGNKSLSVFKDSEVAHSQPSIYALFDRDEPGGGVVGDITGHDYVDLNVDDNSICNIDFSVPGPSGKFKDRLRGVAEGRTELRGALLGQNRSLTVTVVDLKNQTPDPLRPVLQREAIFSATVPRAERHNILFLSEGFTGGNDDRERFSETVTKTAHNLFDADRHAPYPLLKDGFNVWSYYEASKESGVTCGPQLSQDGIPIPSEDLPAPGSPAGAYSLIDLIQVVGLPTPGDAGRSVSELKGIWNTAGSVPRLIGYQNDSAVENVVEAWKKLIPRGIPQAIDSFYGMIHGIRWGERNSVSQDRAEMVAPPAAGDQDFDDKRAKLAKRMYGWYLPNAPTHTIVVDPRRFAPEYKRQGLKLLITHIAKFADPSVSAGNPDRHVGKWWDADTPTDPTAQSRQINSAGLVSLFTNSEHTGGTASRGRMVQVSIGRRTSYTSELDSADPNIRPLNLRPKIEPDFSQIVDTLAHEFGHSFNLGDEYERSRGPGNRDTERYDNLTFVETIQVVPPLGGHSEDFPTPIDPDEIKWAKLHRIALADMLVQKSAINGDQITVKLSSVATDDERATWQRIKAKWQRIKDEHKTVFLRNYKATNGDSRQLPIEFADLYSDLTIESINDDGTLTLSGEAPPLEEFPAGSLVYVPKRDELANHPLTLVESPVLLYMSTTRWKSGDNTFPQGVALTENHNKDTEEKSDPVSKDKDSPPDVRNFDRPPCKTYKLLGLYEGGGTFTTKTYRPAGACKMRSHEGSDGEGEFCFVCKYLIVNRVDPGKHAVLDERYYPKKKTLPAIFGSLPFSLDDIS